MMYIAMKKLAPLAALTGFLGMAPAAFAQIQIVKPGVGYANISDFINAVIRLAFILALVIVLVMMIWGAVQWIFSGGEKEAVAGARDRIIHALIGLAILAVAFALVVIAGQFVGIDLLGKLIIPSPDQPTPTIPKPAQ